MTSVERGEAENERWPNARVLGLMFGPLSVFWCYDSDGGRPPVPAG